MNNNYVYDCNYDDNYDNYDFDNNHNDEVD